MKRQKLAEGLEELGSRFRRKSAARLAWVSLSSEEGPPAGGSRRSLSGAVMRRILCGLGDLMLGSAGVPGANGYFRDKGGGARLGGNRKPEAARPFVLQPLSRGLPSAKPNAGPLAKQSGTQ